MCDVANMESVAFSAWLTRYLCGQFLHDIILKMLCLQDETGWWFNGDRDDDGAVMWMDTEERQRHAKFQNPNHR